MIHVCMTDKHIGELMGDPRRQPAGITEAEQKARRSTVSTLLTSAI